MEVWRIYQRKRTPKAWGWELPIANREYCGKLLKVRAGFRSSVHRHRKKDEVIVVWEGKAVFDFPRRPAVTLGPGDAIHLPPGQWHRFGSRAGGLMIEFSTHHREDDVDRLTSSGRIPESAAGRGEVGSRTAR